MLLFPARIINATIFIDGIQKIIPIENRFDQFVLIYVKPDLRASNTIAL